MIERTLISHLQFRLNGVIISRMIVRPTVLRPTTDNWELVACDESLGTFAIDDNEQLADAALPKFVLEVKDLSVPIAERKLLPNKGWKRMTTSQCLALLESAGVIETRNQP